MNKTNYIILTLILCFSISFMVFPLKALAMMAGEYAGGGEAGGGTTNENYGSCEIITDYDSPLLYNGPVDPQGDLVFGQTGNFSLEEVPVNVTGEGPVVFVVRPAEPAEESEESSSPSLSSPPEEEKEKGWCCNNNTGQCYSCSKTGAWSTSAQCEAHCPSGTYLHCRKSNWSWLSGNQTLYCKPATWYETNPGDECKKDADCQASAPTPTPTKYSCNTSTWTCYENSNGVYSSLSTCESNCKSSGPLSCPGNDYCYACNKSTYQCYQSKNGPYTTLNMCKNHCKKPSTGPSSPLTTSSPSTSPPPASQCQIFEFSINGKTNEDRDPLLVWVKASLKGLISTSTDCVKCTVESDDTWGNPPKDYAMTLVNGYKAEETFKISEAGTYSFTATCQGVNPDDIVVDNASLKAVKAINLPWWQEIIPVLPGFLRGIWK